MQKYRQKKPASTQTEALKAVKSPATASYEQEIEETLDNAEKIIGKNKGLVLFLDKNYLPAEFKLITDEIDNHAINARIPIRKVALVPQVSEAHENYPFSLKFLFQCIVRCHARKGHATMFHAPQILTKFIIMYFKSFVGNQLDRYQLTG
jgi:hypothetical protein